MTLAIDRNTNKIVGQVPFPDLVSPLTGREFFSLRAQGLAEEAYHVLTDNGYRWMPRASVRLERMED